MEAGTKSVDELDGSEPREEAIPVLVEALGGRLHALGLRFCGNPEDAQDLVQEVFLQAFRKWHQFSGGARASTWLYTIAARTCQRFRRRRVGEPARLASLEEVQELGDLAGSAEASLAVVPEGELAEPLRAEARQELERAILGLPEAFRLPLVLKEILGFPLQEIAAVLGLQVATVKTRLHRARLRLRSAVARPLPRRTLPPAAFSRQVCLDLLRAKQEALDHGLAFEPPPGLVCARCAAFFTTLDLTRDLCQDVARGSLPPALRRALLERLGAA